MKNKVKYSLFLVLLLQPLTLYAWSWTDLWQTSDQQGARLLQSGRPQQAAEVFKDKSWQAVAQYRSGNYKDSYQQFQSKKTSDNQYNAGNAAAFQGNYKESIAAYDKAIALDPNNADAIFNREIVKKIMNEQKQSQNKDSDNKKNDKKEGSSDKEKNSNESSQNPEKADKNKPGEQSQSEKERQEKENKSASSQNSKTDSSSVKNSTQEKEVKKNSDGQEFNSGQKNQPASAVNRVQAESEDQRQLLRRIADDPGGLLRQKFLRDYLNRHNDDENADQGET